MKRCKHIKGSYECGSYAFNLHADNIDQGDLCDVHYWQDQAENSSADYTGWDDIPAGTELNTFKPDYNTEAVLVEEMQRMAEELKAAKEWVKKSEKIIAYQDAILMRRRSVERSWVGLTEERIRKIWMKGKDHGDDWADVLGLARAFESELKAKNT